MFRAWIACVCGCFAVTLCFADQITLKNNDHLTGTIVKSDGKVLTLKTEAMGSVDIQMDAIAKLSSDKPVFVQTSSPAQTYSGTLQGSGESLEVVTSSNQTVTVAASNLASLRSESEEQVYQKSQHPGLTQGWTGSASVGFGLTGGNSETDSLSVGFGAVRQGARDKITTYATSVYSTNNAPGADPSTTANTVTGGARYDHDLTQRVFGFVSGDFMTNALQGLNLRSVLGGGLGYHLIKRDTTTLDLLAGINYTRENYVTVTNSFAGALAGEEFMRKLGKSTVLNEKFYIYPDLSDTGEYRTEFDFGTTTKISKWFGWQTAFSDIYVSNPPVGKKGNDVVFATGLNLAFTH